MLQMWLTGFGSKDKIKLYNKSESWREQKGVRKMEIGVRIKKSLYVLAGIFCMIMLLPLTVSADRTKADVQKLLPGYKEWFYWSRAYYPQGGSTDIYLMCPEEDLTFDEILYYLEDITGK